MYRLLIVLMSVILISGCGSDKKSSQFEGIKAQKDYIQQGMDYLRKADVPKAIQSFDKAIQNDPTNPANYLIVGEVYLKLKSYARAADSFASATRVDPANGPAYFLLAESQMMNGQREEAIESAKKSIVIFKAKQEEEKLKNALILLKQLVEPASQAEMTTQEPAK